jgi:hypothetical protein
MTGQQVLLDQISVTMSPQHFKNLCRSLAETLQAYEAVFGTLQIQDAITAPGTKAEALEKMLRDRMASAPNPASSPNEKKRPSKRSRGASRESS